MEQKKGLQNNQRFMRKQNKQENPTLSSDS